MIYFLVPVYNEDGNLPRLYSDTVGYMESMGRKDFRFIFVDDGSTDASLEILRGFAEKEGRTTVLSHSPNAGVRTTFMEGFQEFLSVGKSGDILITKEADNTSDNSILSRMLETLEKDGCDIALASCYAEGGGLESTTFFRTLMSSAANMLIKVRFGLWGLHTFSSFYRAVSYDCLAEAFEKSPGPLMTLDGFVCVVEMLIKLKRMGFKIKEIPMVLRSGERVGKSKMPVRKTIIGYLKLCSSPLK